MQSQYKGIVETGTGVRHMTIKTSYDLGSGVVMHVFLHPNVKGESALRRAYKVSLAHVTHVELEK